jgi:hypothetical protein
MRHDGAALTEPPRATANLLEKIANTSHAGRRRRRHPANVGLGHVSADEKNGREL